MGERDSDDKCVLFVLLMKNYQGYIGFRLDNELYTPYPHEQEYLLSEGNDIHILDVEEYRIRNETPELKDEYNNKLITIIYLFNFW